MAKKSRRKRKQVESIAEQSERVSTQTPLPTEGKKHRGGKSLFVAAVCGILLGGFCMFMALRIVPDMFPSKPAVEQKSSEISRRTIRSLEDLLTANAEEIAQWDIAEMNLLCAVGLPGAEDLDIDKSLFILDKWAERVKTETIRNYHQYRDRPEDFNHSEAYFRILALVTILEQDYRIHYNPMLISFPSSAQRGQLITDYTKDASSIFLHGLLSERRHGTCASLPVLTVAIGRRLGYPLKLVESTEHLFARWESADGQERFNIDSNGRGLLTHPDEFYKSWPHPLTEREIQAAGYLQSLTPVEELVGFLRMRGLALVEAGRLIEAQAVVAQARRLLPESPVLRSLMMALLDKELAERYGKTETFLQQERLAAQSGKSEPSLHQQLMAIQQLPPELQNPMLEDQLLYQINNRRRGMEPDVPNPLRDTHQPISNIGVQGGHQ